MSVQGKAGMGDLYVYYIVYLAVPASSGKTTINWGRPSIWLMNDDPEEIGHVDLNWLRGNCTIVHLTQSLIL